MLEVDIETKACERCLNELGVRSVKLNLTGNAGWPDRLFFIPGGEPLLIEFKRPGYAPEPRQRLIHAFLEYSKYDIQTHDTIAGAFNAVKACLEAAFASGWHPNVKDAERCLEAARLSKESGEVPPRPRSRRAPT